MSAQANAKFDIREFFFRHRDHVPVPVAIAGVVGMWFFHPDLAEGRPWAKIAFTVVAAILIFIGEAIRIWAVGQSGTTTRAKSLKAAAAFSSWLFIVIKRECRKLERMMFRHEPLDEEVAERMLVSRTDQALRIDLTHALESLPVHYLEVVLLRDFEELTISEIAERLDEPSGAIKSRLHRARELVREYMLGSEGKAKT